MKYVAQCKAALREKQYSSSAGALGPWGATVFVSFLPRPRECAIKLSFIGDDTIANNNTTPRGINTKISPHPI
jgi:hypothetical protein